MSGRHEQKYLLHNWSDCCYRDRPQSPRAVLSARLGGAIAPKRTISGERAFPLLLNGDKVRWFLFILGSLATFRLSHLFTKERGPFAVFERLRNAMPRSSWNFHQFWDLRNLNTAASANRSCLLPDFCIASLSAGIRLLARYASSTAGWT
jgi:hypothetical protein